MVFLIFFGLLATAGSYLSQSVCAKRLAADSVSLAFLIYGPAGLGIALVLALTTDVNWLLMGQAWVPVLIYAVAVVGMTCLNLLALRFIDTGLFVLVNFPARTAAAIGLSFLVLGETLAGWQWPGLGLLVIGTLIAHSVHRRGPKLAAGLLYATLAALAYGVAVVSDKSVLDRLDWPTYMTLISLSFSLGTGIFYLAYKLAARQPLVFDRQLIARPLVGLAIFLAALDAVGYGLVLNLAGNVAYVNGLWAFTLILTIILGLVLLKETDHKLVKISGSVVATGGFLLLL